MRDKNSPPTPAQCHAREANWRRRCLLGCVAILRQYGFVREADAVAFALAEEREMRRRHARTNQP